MSAVVVLLVAVVAVLTVLVVGLLRSHAVIVRALHDAGINLDPDDDSTHNGHRPQHSIGDPVRSQSALDLRTVDGVAAEAGVSGQQGHDLVGTLATGGARTIGIKGRQSTLLAFLSIGCGTCAEFWEAFDEGVELPPATRLVIVTKGQDAESPTAVASLAPNQAVTIMSSPAWDDYGVPVAPYFALVDGDSGVVIGEGAAHSWQLVQAMLSRAVADSEAARGVTAKAGRVTRREMFRGSSRHQAVDAELEAAGLEPGDPRLHHSSPFSQSEPES